MTKALHNEQQPLFSMEFQSGGNHDFGGRQTSFYDLHTRLCLSSGMRGINHYLFFGGENDPLLSPVRRHDWGPPVRTDGTLRRHYFRYPQLSQVLASYGRDLALSRPVTVTTIGFLLDYFMTEVNNERTQEATRILTHQRDVVLFDMIARGLSLTHRPFTAVDLDHDELDVATTPLCWVLMEKQCHGATQQKLVDYVRRGGKLILVGRMCVEDFHHRACTILKDALGIKHIKGDLLFAARSITAFDHHDVPVSFLETYSPRKGDTDAERLGEFDEVLAARESGEVVGFLQGLGAGQVLVFGAAVPADTLEDLDIVHQMAIKMGCPPLFQLSDWADVRLSRGENGSFLFVNNYQDDPVETTIACAGTPLFGGTPVHVPARRGLILPLDWQLREGVTIHYATAEITGITEDGSTLTLRTRPDEFVAEMSLSGYYCDHPTTEGQRVSVQGKDGVIRLTRSR